jgi:hypothetical protein
VLAVQLAPLGSALIGVGVLIFILSRSTDSKGGLTSDEAIERARSESTWLANYLSGYARWEEWFARRPKLRAFLPLTLILFGVGLWVVA